MAEPAPVPPIGAETNITTVSAEDELDTILKPLILQEATLHTLAYRFSQIYKTLALESNDQFLPTPVTRLPTGRERGQYLAIDVGGTNLRVAFVTLLGEVAGSESLTNGADKSRAALHNAQRERIRSTLEKAWPIGEHLKMDKAENLFAWIGDCIAEVVADKFGSDSWTVQMPDALDIGITFSFPMTQDEVCSATLMPMGKGFAITSNLKLGPLLLAGYDRHTRRDYAYPSDSPNHTRRNLGPLPALRIAAIANDTIATLCSLAYRVKSLPNTRVVAGIIVGTGCNATVPMKFSALGMEKARKIRSRHPHALETIVNTEITIRGACEPLDGIVTEWDKKLDVECARPGFQPLEQMTGGRYIGELVRIIFFDYMTRPRGPAVSPSALPAQIVDKYSLSTQLLSSVVARVRSNKDLATELERRIPPPESSDWTWTETSAAALKRIARLVQTRSAALIAAATVGLLNLNEITLGDPSISSSKKTALSATSLPIRPGEVIAYETMNNEEPHANVTGSGSAGPEELVVGYTGGIIQFFPNYREQCQRFIDRLVMRAGPQEGGKSVFLREARDGGILGAGVLAGMEAERLA